MDPMLAMICLWPVNWIPQGWASCNGQSLAVSTNAALYSLIGTIYGGDTTNFALPDFRSRMPVGTGQGVGSYINYALGTKAGVERITLTTGNLPTHNHAASATFTTPLSVTINANNTAGIAATPTAGSSLAASSAGRSDGSFIYNTATPNTALNAATATVSGGAISVVTGLAGSSAPVTTLSPVLAVYFIIATEGLYPARP